MIVRKRFLTYIINYIVFNYFSILNKNKNNINITNVYILYNMGIYTSGKIFGIKIYTFNDDDISYELFERQYDVVMSLEQMKEAYLFYLDLHDKNNIRYDERIEITRGLKKDTYSAGVILNLSKKTVERNRFGDNRSFDEMFKYFFKGYNKYITQVMVQLDAEYFNKMLDEMQAESQRASAEQEKTEQPAE